MLNTTKWDLSKPGLIKMHWLSNQQSGMSTYNQVTLLNHNSKHR